MGCCHSEDLGLKEENFGAKIKEGIDLASTNRLTATFEFFRRKHPQANPPWIDKEIVKINEVIFNPLSYCLFLGKTAMFKFLYESGASVKTMEELLVKHNLKGINLICYKGYKDLLEFYLPIYLQNYISVPQSVKSYTIDLKDSQNIKPDFDLPIHSACRAGMINVVSYLYKYFKDKDYCPKEFDVLATDDFNGEDCALIACRVGCYALVKFFYENCQINFNKLNAHRENAIMICIAGHNRSPNFTYVECLEYLVGTVGVDITYKYEELLCMVEGKEMIAFVERELEKKGINLKKKDVDSGIMRVQLVADTVDSTRGPIFTEETLKNVEPEHRSFLSTISVVEHPPDRPSDFFSHKFE